MNSQYIKNKEGFTLVEVLISMTIFSFLVFAVIAIYIAFNNTQIHTTAGQRLLNDSQYAMELMVKEVRNNAIVFYAPNCNSVISDDVLGSTFNECIILEKENGQIFAFSSYNDGSGIKKFLYILLDCPGGYANCEDIDVSSGEATELLSADLNNISLDELLFSITPITNPFVAGGPNQQPKVTINMTTSYISDNQNQNVDHTFQTTVSSRIYRR
jgi:prepilin-type N-terminal cleavage/methylation domain-containing protein